MSKSGPRSRCRLALLAGAVVVLSTTTPHAGIFTVFGPRTVTRTAGPPNVFNFTFRVSNPSLPYTLRIDNHGVDSAVVILNGVQIIGPSDCRGNGSDDWRKSPDWDDDDWDRDDDRDRNRGNDRNRDDDWRRDRHWKGLIQKAVRLRESNTLRVELRSKPGTHLRIQIFGTDNVRPGITATPAPLANNAGWNRTNVKVDFSCTDSGSGVAFCPPSNTVTTEGRGQVVSGTAVDYAGNRSTATVTLNIDKKSPTIQSKLEPAPNGAGWINRDGKVSFACTDDRSGIASCPSSILVPTEGRNQVVRGETEDRAGNKASTSVTVNLDKSPPTIKAKTQPPPAQGVNDTDVIVTFECADAVSGIAFCSPPKVVSAEGSHVVDGTAIDNAGHSTSVHLTVNIVKTPASITIASPASGTLTQSSTITVAGSVVSHSNATVSVNGIPASVTGMGPFQFAAVVPIVEGTNSLTATATDAAGRTSHTSVVVIRDTLPPSVDVVTPERISRSQPGQAVAEVTDANGVADVVFLINGVAGTPRTAPPFVQDLVVPDGARNGDTMDVTVRARDRAGNSFSVSRGVRIAADGVIVGQVLSDITGLNVAGASVSLSSGASTITDESGRYLLSATDSSAVVLAEMEGMTSVQRAVTAQFGVGTVPVDARLTPRAGPLVTDGGDRTVDISSNDPRPWKVTLSIPANAFPQGTELRATPLSPQGLPLLLPLSWSPVAAFELRAGDPPAVGLSASVTGVDGATVLVRHEAGIHAWRVVQTGLAPGAISVVLSQPGTYAFISQDPWYVFVTGPVPGEILSGVGAITLPSATVATAHGAPPTLPASGGVARGHVVVQSPGPVPSGSVIQAALTEQFGLASGDVASGDKRYQDLILYGFPPPQTEVPPPSPGVILGATFPITPSRAFNATELSQGNIHVDVLAGRESVRGTIGGSGAIELDSGGAHLSIGAGTLPADVAVDFQSVPLSTYLAASGSLVPLEEVVVDLSAVTLAQTATLSRSAAGLSATDTYVVAKVERLAGVPKLVVVALGQITGGRLISVPYPGLRGITQGGRYVFYRSTGPVGFVKGVTSSTAGPVAALISTSSLPFVAFSGSDGAFIVAAAAGPVAVSAAVAGTNLVATRTAQVSAGATAILNLPLAGAVTTATVTPANGAVGVATNAEINVDTSVAFNAATVTADSVRLYKGPATDNLAVPVRFVVGANGRRLAVIPQSKLDPATPYTLVAAGLADLSGGLINVPTTTFVTMATSQTAYDVSRLTFSFPDTQGIVKVTAPPGTLPAGTTILIIDSSNGVVVSFMALNDGSVQGDFPASINDVLMVTITDPLGNVTTFTRSQYVAADGTTAIGPGGGVVRGAGGVEVRVPEGALEKGITLKIETFGPDAFPERPDFPEAQFGGGLRMVSSEIPTFKKPLTLAFPVPTNLPAGAKPEDAFYYVYRRLQGPNGQAAFETVDHAFVEGTGSNARVVTASFPFSMASHNYNGYDFDSAGQVILLLNQQAIFYLMQTIDQLKPGIPLKGVVTGKVLRASYQPGVPDPTFVPIRGAVVSGVDADGNPLLSSNPLPGGSPTVALSQEDGTFALWDKWPTGGTIKLVASTGRGGPSETQLATGFEDDILDTKSPAPALKYYRNRVTVNFTFPPLQQSPENPEGPRLEMVLLHPGGDDAPYRARSVVAGGFVLAGSSIFVGINADCGASTCTLSLQLDGSFIGTFADPLKLVEPGHPFAKDVLAGLPLVTVGARRLSATVRDAFGNVGTASLTFRVVASGQGNNTNLPGVPPAVITNQTSPSSGAVGIDVTSPMQVVFTEPVSHVPGNVGLEEILSGFQVPVTIFGVTLNGGVVVVDDSESGTGVSALTIQPKASLKYGMRYRLTVSRDIVDLRSDPKESRSSAVRG